MTKIGIKIQRRGVRLRLRMRRLGSKKPFQCWLYYQIMRSGRDIVYYIEEPEAHLFPTTQKSIVSLIGLLHKGRGQRFFLTTHSPYILTAFNILLATSDALSKKPKRKRKIPTFIDDSTAIPFDDIAAYSLKDGEITDILDRSVGLIGSSVIDGVSDEFEQIFEKICFGGKVKNLAKCSIPCKNKETPVEERGKKFVIRNGNVKEIEIIKVVVDNCLIDDETERCDFLFLVNRRKEVGEIIYVELKGMDVPKAASQIRSTLTSCSALNEKRKKFCYIVCRRSPLSGPKLNVLKSEFLKTYGAILRVKSIIAEHSAQ